MIKKELDDDINPYLADDDTHYKLHNSHYVLGQNDYREIQARAKKRREELQNMIKELGVEGQVKLHDRAESVSHMNIKMYYLKHKEVFDRIFDAALEVCDMQYIVESLEKLVNSKS